MKKSQGLDKSKIIPAICYIFGLGMGYYMILIGLAVFLRITPMHYNSPEEAVHFLKVTEKLAK